MTKNKILKVIIWQIGNKQSSNIDNNKNFIVSCIIKFFTCHEKEKKRKTSSVTTNI